MTQQFKVEEHHFPEFRKIYPAAENKNYENVSEALKILNSTANSFAKSGVKSEIHKILAKTNPASPGLEATFGAEVLDGKPKSIVYSIKLETKKGGVEGSTIITLRVGPNFTEMSLVKDGKVCEILLEKDKKIVHQTVT